MMAFPTNFTLHLTCLFFKKPCYLYKFSNSRVEYALKSNAVHSIGKKSSMKIRNLLRDRCNLLIFRNNIYFINLEFL